MTFSARLGMLSVVIALAAFAISCDGDDESDTVLDGGTVLPTSIAQKPGAPRDVGTAFPSTVTPPDRLRLRTDIESRVPALDGRVTDVRIELDRVLVVSELTADDRSDADTACDQLLAVPSLSTYSRVVIEDASGNVLANCNR